MIPSPFTLFAATATGPGRIQDPVLVFAVVMLLMLLAPLLFSRMRVPGIVGLIMAGILAGPHGIGWFALDQTFELLGKVGLLYLMFLAGLEINLREFARQRRHSLTFGSLTFLIPQVGGALTARWLFGYSWATAILLASMFASHTLVTYPLIAQLKLTRNRAVTTSVGGTILTDIAALMVLAVVEQSVAGSLTGWFWFRQGLLLLCLLVGTLWLLPLLGYWFFSRAQPDAVAEYLFIVTAAFLCSYAASLAGVEPIIGAFLAGLALGQLVPERSVLMTRVQFMGHALFIPFFLLSVGMRVDLTILAGSPRVWAVALYMTAAVHLAKWLAAELSGRLLGYRREERRLMFGISVNQAAATLAAVLVGVRIGLFDASIMNGTILMILVSCLVGAWVTDRSGRRVAADTQAALIPPRREDRILIPLGNKMSADALMDFALLLRDRDAHEPLYPMHVALDGPEAEAHVADGEALLQNAVMRAVAADAAVEPLTRLDTNRAAGILRAIREQRISCVILGWRRREAGLGRFFQDLLEQVLDRTPIGLFASHLPQPLNSMRRLLLLLPPRVAQQPGFEEAVRRCFRLAQRMGALWLAIGDEETLARLPRGPGLGIKANGSSLAAADWRQWPEILAPICEPSDLIAVIGARRGRIAWHPGLERSLQRLNAQYPGNNLLVVYPSDAEAGGEEPEPDARPELCHVLRLDRTAPLAEVRRKLLEGMLGDAEAAQGMDREFDSVPPLPLAEGVLLLHAHSPGVRGVRIGAAVARDPARIRVGTAEARLAFVLVSEQGIPPETHLRALAGIARMARDPAVRERLEEGAEPGPAPRLDRRRDES